MWNRAGVLRQLERHIRAFVAEYVKPGDQVIDYGCGEMPYRPLFQECGAQYIGCDIKGDCDVRFEPDRPLPLPNGYADALISNQVLEHVWNVGSYLGEAYRLLKPGGVLCLTSHGFWWYHAHPEDYFRWTRIGLERLLGEAGFELLETIPVMNILNFASFVWADILGRALHRIPLLGRVLTAGVNLLLFWSYPLFERILPKHLSKDNSAVYLIIARKPAGENRFG